MSENEQNIPVRKKYSSLNGLGRTAMLAGIHLIPAICVVVGFVFISFLLQIFFGAIAFLSIIFVFPIVLFLRQVTASDDRALRILGLELLCIFKRRNYKLFGNTLTFLASEYGANVKAIKQYFEKPKQRGK